VPSRAGLSASLGRACSVATMSLERALQGGEGICFAAGLSGPAQIRGKRSASDCDGGSGDALVGQFEHLSLLPRGWVRTSQRVRADPAVKLRDLRI